MIPSIICSLLIFYHFVRFSQIRKKLNNHVILILLLVNFIQVALGLFDWFCNIFTPIIISIIATIILIVRVLLQKRRVGQRAIWQRNRKMVLQLASVSLMYIIVWIPIIVGFVIPLIIPNAFILQLSSAVFIYFEYISFLFCPFMCLTGLPEIRQSIKNIFIRNNIIQPTIQIK
ncbi:unnamed protein product [Adineta steineri]|uniref:G-protein coupled receptors family 1 profile domain-containing protein n=1 Tax=Adineta steineri TaxID=433720 RepID=A0A813TEK7_9BILA|nr:unnamed protein product [Adineta steineri]CAF4026084.1 unnamed protein product [Adineta steineri]